MKGNIGNKYEKETSLIIEIIEKLILLDVFLFTVTVNNPLDPENPSKYLVLFGTTVSVSKTGRLASCSHLEKTREMFEQKWDPKDKQKVFRKDKNGELILKDTSSILLLLRGKCYRVENGTNTFSELLYNEWKFGHPKNTEGRIFDLISFYFLCIQTFAHSSNFAPDLVISNQNIFIVQTYRKMGST